MSDLLTLNRQGGNAVGAGSRIIWSEEQIDFIINHYNEHNNVKEIAKLFNTSQATISNLLHKYNIYTLTSAEKVKNIKKRNSAFFKVIDTPEKAYWLGFLYADGGISQKRYNIRINLKQEDKDHLEKFLKAIEAENIQVKHCVKNMNDKEYQGCYVCIGDKEMVTDLINHGCTPKKSLTLIYPNESILPDKFKYHFIRGYFDGDGSIGYDKPNKNTHTKYWRASILGTYDMISNIQRILHLDHLKIQHYSNHYCLEFGGTRNVFKTLLPIYQYSYDDIELTRKRIKFDELTLQCMGGEPVNTGCE